MEQKEIEIFVEAALLAAGRPLSIDNLQGLFDGRSTPEKSVIRAAIKTLNEGYAERGIEIAEVASGFRMQVQSGMAERLHKLWEERPPRYSRALFETLALIAYRQPITRAEIEEVRGVSVSSNIMRSLVEREWVRVVGHRDVPGRPAMFGTTKAFLDYFSLKKLDDLPELADLSDWESLRVQLDLPEVDGDTPAQEGEATNDGEETAESAKVTELPVEPANDDAGEEPQVSDDVVEAEANIPELAVEEDEVTEVPELAAADEPAAEIPELVPEEAEAEAAPAQGVELPELSELADEQAGDEELVATEWPDPVDASSIATLETSDADPDNNANKA